MNTKIQKTLDTLEASMEKMIVQSRRTKQKEERMHLSYIDDICSESLDPETMDKWQDVRKVLLEIRTLQ